MHKTLHPEALFRLMILGPLASRGELRRGEVRLIARQLAMQPHQIPHSSRVYLSEQTILRWYYLWKKGGAEALNPIPRSDKGSTHLTEEIQAALLQLKQDNPSRSINTIISILEKKGTVAKNVLSRATVHRFLKKNKSSKRIMSDITTIERRSFVAEHAGDIWHGDVLHGPSVQTPSGMRKTYLVSLLDDASRLIAHTAFCLGETALDIEGVLKQALLKRGLPRKIIIDNGAAYRAGSLQAICGILEIRLVYCRPYEPQGKGKLERFHRTFREQFLSEVSIEKIASLDELNALLWAWIEQVYHESPHAGLEGKWPITQWRADLMHIRPLSPLVAHNIDTIFHHRFERVVKKDATISWEGMRFEVPHMHVGEKVILVVDPHARKGIKIESTVGDDLGPVALLDLHANLHRKRQRPNNDGVAQPTKQGENLVDLAYQAYQESYHFPSSNEKRK